MSKKVFFLIFLFISCAWMFRLYVYLCTMWVSGAYGRRKGHQIPGNWSCRRLWVIMWILRLKPGSSITINSYKYYVSLDKGLAYTTLYTCGEHARALTQDLIYARKIPLSYIVTPVLFVSYRRTEYLSTRIMLISRRIQMYIWKYHCQAMLRTIVEAVE